jgi:hypothetical protein
LQALETASEKSAPASRSKPKTSSKGSAANKS